MWIWGIGICIRQKLVFGFLARWARAATAFRTCSEYSQIHLKQTVFIEGIFSGGCFSYWKNTAYVRQSNIDKMHISTLCHLVRNESQITIWTTFKLRLYIFCNLICLFLIKIPSNGLHHSMYSTVYKTSVRILIMSNYGAVFPSMHTVCIHTQYIDWANNIWVSRYAYQTKREGGATGLN